MQCPRCQHENREGRRFCAECGGSLALECAACGFLNEGGEKFCGGCGTALGAVPTTATPKFTSPDAYTPRHLAEKIITSKASLEGERKQVTVLFADLKGSMELLADRDPEEARKILDPVLERMMEAVHRYEGTVNQVMGDGIMALFGAPVAHEDHAVRACYAALRMQESLKRYTDDTRRSHGVEVQIRVGLNSGEVVVRSVGSDLRMDYTAVGQTTHLAARMEQLADPGAIVITPNTLALAEGYVAVKSLGPVPVRGLAAPMDLYEVTGAGTVRSRLQAAAARGLTRFVGRDAEMEQLRRAQQLASEGHGQVVALVGEAGVGKSRFVYEFTHSHRLQGWLLLESTSVSYGKATSYLPVIDLLKGYFKIQDRDDLGEIREKVTGKLLTLDEALRPTLPAVLALLDVPVDDATWPSLDPGRRRQLTLDGVKRLLLREAREQPLLLIFEDLHWIDGETQALLDSLVESLGSARLLLLVNYRPEYEHRWGSKAAYSQLRLDSLRAESAADLLAALLGPDPGLAPLTQMLVKRGNPFFLEETVRTLVETKALAGERGRYRLTQPVQSIQVPPTVQVMLAARIDRLPLEDKRLLQVASVVGKDVPFTLLQAIAELSDEALRRGLDHLQAAEFLYETGLFPDLEYSFKHALTHEVTYGGLLQDRRRGLHARIVDAIETLYRDRLAEQTEQLAHHAFRGEVWDKVLLYARQAGMRGLDRSAYAQAGAYFDQALDALTHLPETRETTEQHFDLLGARSSAHSGLGEYEQQRGCSETRVSLAEALEDQHRLAQAVSSTANALWQIGDNVRACAVAQRGLLLAEAIGDAVSLVQSGLNLGMILRTMGDYRGATAVLAKPVALLQGDLARELLGRAMYPAITARLVLADCLTWLGEFSQAIAAAEEGIRIAEAIQQPASLLNAHHLACYPLLAQGRFHDVIPRLERSLALWNASDVASFHHQSAGTLGYAYAMAGRLTEAFPLLEQAVERARRVDRRNETRLLVYFAEAYLHAGQQGDANATAARALDLSRDRCERGAEACAMWLLGEIHAQYEAPNAEQTETYYCKALALAEELGMRPLVAHCHLGLGKLYRRTGKREQAREHLATATTMCREMDMRFYLEQAETELRELGA